MPDVKADLIKTVKDAKALEGIWVKKEKGEGIAKLSTPRNHEESQALGHFDAEVNLIGNGLYRMFEIQNYFATLGGKRMENACYAGQSVITDIFRSSASKGFGRGKATMETIKDIKPDISGGHDFPEREEFGYDDDKK